MTKHDERLTTVVSTKGQVVLPAAVRKERHWHAGTRLLIEETPDGILLKNAPLFAPTRIEDVAGMLKHDGRPRSLQDMDNAVTEAVREKNDRGRF
ncbi:looped-hinge helix DNA binding domain-containing protein, AbrB family [Phyllobacterium sp. CL33Tsu]|uniref:AbrB/MazE/SpoVT family DNA-binding domain-containing protein n=1 Tax=Phyllobacterium sp. CL33Tsu TaxID=1798191 RepID=UPI0008E12BC1|nr:AbrB/MazE/SpoVT family DNA-binding domain-containing protein [Phyllobacterium sp. CL33Tsu]SFJ49163.1 looped-hinge helix DNA binding domain-containing protein, AbrB family [Phyllobacterium sp. CL33Tsu]